jgi:hypothetical protein
MGDQTRFRRGLPQSHRTRHNVAVKRDRYYSNLEARFDRAAANLFDKWANTDLPLQLIIWRTTSRFENASEITRRFLVDASFDTSLQHFIELGLPELTIEWLAIDAVWMPLFSDLHRTAAITRLQNAGVSRSTLLRARVRATPPKRFWAAIATALGVIGILIAIIKVYSASPSPLTQGLISPIAPDGSLTLPARVPAGPAIWSPSEGGSYTPPAQFTREFTTPQPSSQAYGEGCYSSGCQIVMKFSRLRVTNAPNVPLPLTTTNLNIYFALVYPTSENMNPMPGASDLNEDGAGDVVLTPSFLHGWFCVRLAAAVGLDARFEPHTNWSQAECFFLNPSGVITRSATRN